MRLTLTEIGTVSEYAPSVEEAIREFISDLLLQARHGCAKSYGYALRPVVGWAGPVHKAEGGVEPLPVSLDRSPAP